MFWILKLHEYRIQVVRTFTTPQFVVFFLMKSLVFVFHAMNVSIWPEELNFRPTLQWIQCEKLENQTKRIIYRIVNKSSDEKVWGTLICASQRNHELFFQINYAFQFAYWISSQNATNIQLYSHVVPKFEALPSVCYSNVKPIISISSCIYEM